MPCPLLQSLAFNCLFNDHLMLPPSNCQFVLHVTSQMRMLQLATLSTQRAAT
jgi:hypothetical protein